MNTQTIPVLDFRRPQPSPHWSHGADQREEHRLARFITELGADLGSFVLGHWSTVTRHKNLPGAQDAFFDFYKAAPNTQWRGRKYAATALLPVLRSTQAILDEQRF